MKNSVQCQQCKNYVKVTSTDSECPNCETPLHFDKVSSPTNENSNFLKKTITIILILIVGSFASFIAKNFAERINLFSGSSNKNQNLVLATWTNYDLPKTKVSLMLPCSPIQIDTSKVKEKLTNFTKFIEYACKLKDFEFSLAEIQLGNEALLSPKERLLFIAGECRKTTFSSDFQYQITEKSNKTAFLKGKYTKDQSPHNLIVAAIEDKDITNQFWLLIIDHESQNKENLNLINNYLLKSFKVNGEILLNDLSL